MSPLARSQLAFAVLFAVLFASSDAFCTSEVYGNNTDREELLRYSFSREEVENGGHINIEDSCDFGKTIGVSIHACNSHHSRHFTNGQSPNVSFNMTHAHVQCAANACPTGVHVDMVKYCDTGKYVDMP